MKVATRKRSSPQFDLLYAELCRQLEDGTLQPTQRVPQEMVLARQYSISRGTVRKVLASLAERGVIDREPGRRRFVNEPSRVSPRARRGLTGTLRVLTYWPTLQADNIARLTAAFNGAFPGVKVEMLRIHSQEQHDEVVRLCSEGNPPDVVHVPGQHLDALCEAVPVVPMQEMLDADALESIYPAVRDATSIDGRQVAYPLTSSPIMLAYNRTHFEEAGLSFPDETWTSQTWIEAIDRLAVNGPGSERRYGFAFAPSVRRWGALIAQAGGAAATDWRKTPAMTVQGVAEACQFAYDLSQRPSVIRGIEISAEEMFSQGIASMVLCSLTGLKQLMSREFETDVAPVPFGPKPGTLLLASGFVVPQMSRNAALGRQFIRFVSSSEVQTILRCSGAGIPPLRQVAENMQFASEFVHPRGYASFTRSLDHAYSFQRGSDAEIEKVTTALFGKFLMGLLKANELCAQVDGILEARLQERSLLQKEDHHG